MGVGLHRLDRRVADVGGVTEVDVGGAPERGEPEPDGGDGRAGRAEGAGPVGDRAIIAVPLR
jgi:hypothetical protein